MTVDLHAALAELLAATVDAKRLYDLHNGGGREDIGLRIGQMVSEAGETLTAWLGYVGHNPRKGVCCGLDKVAAEDADVLASSLLVLFSLDGIDPAEVIGAVARKVRERAAEGLAAGGDQTPPGPPMRGCRPDPRPR